MLSCLFWVGVPFCIFISPWFWEMVHDKLFYSTTILLPRHSSQFMHECGAIGSASHHLVGSASCSLACPVPQSATLLGPSAAALLRVLSLPAARLRPSYWSG